MGSPPSTGRSTSPRPSRPLLCTIAAFAYLPGSFDELDRRHEQQRHARADPGGDLRASRPATRASSRLVAVLIGIVLAALILALTGYFTGTEYRPVRDVGKTSLTGAATVILSGLSVGFESAVYTALVIAAAVYGAFLLGGGADRRLAVRGRAGGLWSADHRRRHRRDGHLRPGLRQRPGHRRDVRRRRRGGRGDPDRARRGRQHHEGHHQGHRDRHGRAGGDRAVRLVHRRGHAGRGRRRRVRRTT